MMKKLFPIIAFVIIGITAIPSSAWAKMEKLVLAGPKSSVTHPMAYIIEAGLLKNVAEEVELVIWDNPDQLRSLLAGDQAHFSAVPSYVAAAFYNKGVPVRLANISTWGILWILSADPEVKKIADLKGQEIAVAYRNDMPDLVFQNIVIKQHLDPKVDFKLSYHTNHPTVVQEILSGRVQHAILAEPLVSVALMKSKKMAGKAPKLYRSINIQKEWGDLYNTAPQIPQAGICVMPSAAKRPEVVQAFQKAYADAIQWCNQNPEAAGKIVAKYISGLKAKPVAASLKNAGLKFVSAQDAKGEIIKFYSVLNELNPAKVGGKLPADDFYWKATQ